MAEAEAIARLISDRGYTKSCMTRMEKYCVSEEFAKATLETLVNKRERTTQVFLEYEKLNKDILFRKPDDQENYEEYEKKRAVAMENSTGEKLPSAAPASEKIKSGKASFLSTNKESTCSSEGEVAINTDWTLPGQH